MLGLVCDDHMNMLEERLAEMQDEGKIPKGRIKFQPVTTVTTDCVMGLNEDYIEMELKRGLETDRNLT